MATSWPYGVSAVLLGAVLLAQAHQLDTRIRRGRDSEPMRLFHWSTTYLALLFGALAADALIV